MLTKAKRAVQTVRHLGPAWAAYRTGYALQQKSGWLARRMPVVPWNERPLVSFLDDPALGKPAHYLDYRRTHAPRFFIDPAARPTYAPLLTAWDGADPSVVALADNICAGTLRYFDHLDVSVGLPPDWHRNALTGQCAPADVHWSRLDDFGFGDIKVIWEPSRFGFTYALVRAYWRTGDPRYADCFWELVEDWRRHNPPHLGVNWKCGQETSFRVMAWCFGLYGFLDAAASTPARVADLAQMIALSGERIEANLGYALSQRNNHGISEAMGLWTIGLLFPEFCHAERWQARGRQVLEQLAIDLIYDDGSFVQHSVNYHRLMLQDFIWALRLGEVNGIGFSTALNARIAAAANWLFQMQDQTSGYVPWYGQTDGAHVLPLANCDYLDMRPTVQAAHFLVNGTRRYHDGPWDEALLWLFGPEAVTTSVDDDSQADLRADDGGYYTLRTQSGFAFVRCATYSDRPGQADMLHVDLWRQGECIVGDAGTFSYNAPTPWNNPLAATAYHNTVTVDGLDQMERAGKFLWLPWLHSYVLAYRRSSQGTLAYWEGAHDGYTRLPQPVQHRRALVAIGQESWLVLDRLVSNGAHDYRLHWLIHALSYHEYSSTRSVEIQSTTGPFHLQVIHPEADGAWSLVTADPSSPRGWRAPYYHARRPASSVAYVVSGDTVTLATWFGPHQVQTEFTPSQWQLSHSGQTIRLDWTSDDDQPLLSAIRIHGTTQDELAL